MIRLDLRIELNYGIDDFGADLILNIHPALTAQQRVLNENDGNISATARALKMHRRTLQRKLSKRPVRT